MNLLRQVGNCGAHPKKNSNTSEIVEIEEGEAEILLKILEKLFDEVFVKPQITKKNIELLTKKFVINKETPTHNFRNNKDNLQTTQR